MHAEYHIFNFDQGAAGRWRTFWTTRARRVVKSFGDKFLCYAIEREPSRRLPQSHSTLPGLDEQWMGEIDRDIQHAEQQGTVEVELPAIAARYRAVAERTNSACAWERVGVSFLRMGKPTEARSALVKAERLGRQTAITYAALGVLDAQEGHLGSAVRYFRRSLRHGPGLEETRRNLVHVLWQLGNRETAVGVLREGLRLNPASAELRQLWVEITNQATSPSPLP